MRRNQRRRRVAILIPCGCFIRPLLLLSGYFPAYSPDWLCSESSKDS